MLPKSKRVADSPKLPLNIGKEQNHSKDNSSSLCKPRNLKDEEFYPSSRSGNISSDSSQLSSPADYQPHYSFSNKFKHMIMESFPIGRNRTKSHSSHDEEAEMFALDIAKRSPNDHSLEMSSGTFYPLTPSTSGEDGVSANQSPKFTSPKSNKSLASVGTSALSPAPPVLNHHQIYNKQVVTTQPTSYGIHDTNSGGISINSHNSHSPSSTEDSPSSSLSKSTAHKIVGKGGKLLQRFRSLSVGQGNPTEEYTNDSINNKLPDPGKLPKVSAQSQSLMFSRSLSVRQCAAENRVRKLSIPLASSPSQCQGRINASEFPSSNNYLGEELIRRLPFINNHNELEKALNMSGELGLAAHALQVGVTRASENKRILMLSKSPLRTREEFLQEGVQELEEELAYRTFFELSTCYDLMPNSGKLILVDSRLPIGQAFRALVYHSIRAAPVWNSILQQYTGVLTISDFIRIMDIYYHSPQLPLEEVEAETVGKWLDVIAQHKNQLLFITPGDSLLNAVHLLNQHHIHRLPVIDERSGDLLHIITHKRLLKYLWLRHRDLPEDKRLCFTLEQSNLLNRQVMTSCECASGSGVDKSSSPSTTMNMNKVSTARRPSASLFTNSDAFILNNAEDTQLRLSSGDEGGRGSGGGNSLFTPRPVYTVRPNTTVMRAMRLFLEHRVSALPVVNENNRLLDILSKFDCINLAITDSRKDLNVTVAQILKIRRFQDFTGVLTCHTTDTLRSIMEKFVNHDVHRLVVVNNMTDYQVTGILSLSDFIAYLFEKPEKINSRSVKRSNMGSEQGSSSMSLDLSSDLSHLATTVSSSGDSPLLSTSAPSPRGASSFRVRYRQRSNTTESLPEEEEEIENGNKAILGTAIRLPLTESGEDEVFANVVM